MITQSKINNNCSQAPKLASVGNRNWDIPSPTLLSLRAPTFLGRSSVVCRATCSRVDTTIGHDSLSDTFPFPHGLSSVGDIHDPGRECTLLSKFTCNQYIIVKIRNPKTEFFLLTVIKHNIGQKNNLIYFLFYLLKHYQTL